jgi:hypothetical protein
MNRLVEIVLFVCFIILCSPNNIFAQNEKDTLTKNAIYVTGGTFGLWVTGNINYERLISANDSRFFKQFHLHADAGRFLTWGAEGYFVNAKAIALSGPKRSHLELGFGFAYFF